MLRADSVRAAGASGRAGGFVLYLEGPADRGVLEGWCRQLLPGHTRRLSRATVILGGRQPARAIEHFRGLGGAAGGNRGLCLLDRDDGARPALPDPPEPGLEFFTWGRRHIESYLLVPTAIRRGLNLPDGRIERALRGCLPDPGDEPAWRELDAKRLLARTGPLAGEIDAPIRPARVARAMRRTEIHPDVHRFFERLARELGVVDVAVVR
jgi:hypothetical protein